MSEEIELGYCPSCGELPNQSGEMKIVLNAIEQEMQCECGCEWIDKYRLVSSVKVVKK